MNIRLMGRQKNCRATFNRFGIDISIQLLININLAEEMLILPVFCSFLRYGIGAGPPSFQEALKPPQSFHAALGRNTKIFSENFSRIKIGPANTMWIVRFMLMLHWNYFEIQNSKLDPFGLPFNISQL